jgi:hypothetical protein
MWPAIASRIGDSGSRRSEPFAAAGASPFWIGSGRYGDSVWSTGSLRAWDEASRALM